jgi:hypothetical protein
LFKVPFNRMAQRACGRSEPTPDRRILLGRIVRRCGSYAQVTVLW